VNHYEQRQEARRERLEARAERLRKEAGAAFHRADLREEVSGIPFGQPILVGHHSEKRHRAVIARANRALDKGIALNKAANEAASRAAGVGSGGISSDDPETISKLKAELAEKVALHTRMKAANVILRKHDGPAAIPALILAGFSEAKATSLAEPPDWGTRGFTYSLTNNNGNMKRIKGRIAHLERVMAERAPLLAAGIERQVMQGAGGLEIVENLELNRLQMIFPGKPAPDVIKALKSYGFRWSPSEGAWQRHLSNAAKYAAEQIERVVAQ
jgi:hypothetical protein